MLFTLLQIVLALAVLLIILSKYFDSRLKMIHTETGKEMPIGSGFLQFIPTMLFPLKNSMARTNSMIHQKLGPVVARYQLFRPVVSVATPELAKQVLTDSKTFEKPDQQIGKLNDGLSKLMNENNVVFVNGDEWKRQRKSINPGFYDLSIYANQISEKTKTSMDFIKKNPKIGDIHDLLQKLTL